MRHALTVQQMRSCGAVIRQPIDPRVVDMLSLLLEQDLVVHVSSEGSLICWSKIGMDSPCEEKLCSQHLVVFENEMPCISL
jgi:hypothetical protein